METISDLITLLTFVGNNFTLIVGQLLCWAEFAWSEFTVMYGSD